MRAEGLEPPRTFAHRHLKPARLPISPRPRSVRSILGPGSGQARSLNPVSNSGFAHAQSTFGGTGLSANVLGTFTVLLSPVQLLLMIFASIGFAQGWNVEIEVPIQEAKRRGAPPAQLSAA